MGTDREAVSCFDCERNRLMGKLYVTLDTEMDADIHWHKSNTPCFSSVLEGIPNYLRPIWDQYQVNPIYFVSPEVAENELCCNVLKNEIKKGAVIGAHLHPEYIEPEKKGYREGVPSEFPCFAYERDIEKEKLKNLVTLIENNLGVKPMWYRAARFGADDDTIAILKELGFRYDSSVTPCIDWSKKGGPDHRKGMIRSYYIRGNEIYSSSDKKEGIKEYPVTIMGKRWGVLGKLLPDNWLFYKWIRPSHMTYAEQKKMLKTAKKSGIKDIVMMFHTMEVMINKTPYVRNSFMQSYFLWRLRKTIGYAKKMGYSAQIQGS